MEEEKILIENKPFTEYSKTVQKKLLLQWFVYFSNLLLKKDEYNTFLRMIEDDPELVFQIASVSLYVNESSERLIYAMRLNSLYDYTKVVLQYAKSEEYLKEKSENEKRLIALLTKTYNVIGKDDEANYGFPIPFENVVYDTALLFPSPLHERQVQRLYLNSSLSGKEIMEDKPVVDFVIGQGLNKTFYFSSTKLQKNKNQILKMLNKLPSLQNGLQFNDLMKDFCGRTWTYNSKIADLLLGLGTAIGKLAITQSDETSLSDYRSNAMILETKNNKDIISYPPYEYKKQNKQ